MSQTNRNTLIALAAALAVVALAYYAWKERQYSQAPPATVASTSEATSTRIPVSSIMGTTTASGYTITRVPLPQGVRAPDYTAPLKMDGSVPAGQQELIKAQFAQAQTTIAKDPKNFEAWILLGNMREEAGDYEGAASDWQYMSELYPANTVSFSNLGDLYIHFLPDYPKADALYQQEIKNYPAALFAYEALYELYTSSQYPQSPATVESLLQKGIASNPNAVELQLMLARYYKSLGRTADAQAEYAAAIQNATRQGNTALAASIKAETGQ